MTVVEELAGLGGIVHHLEGPGGEGFVILGLGGDDVDGGLTVAVSSGCNTAPGVWACKHRRERNGLATLVIFMEKMK